MMLDWFLLLTPILLFPIFLLFIFIGCIAKGEISDPLLTVTFVLRQNRLDPVPEITIVFFRWVIESNGDGSDNTVSVEDPEEETGDSGELIRVFRHRIENAEPGQWTVTCIPYSESIGFDEALCTFLLFSQTSTVQFEIVSDPNTGGRVQVSPGGCPG